ncbi:uncharacterized protein FPRN_11115 [Fusarium proliferatum]|nr:uncharacterized protein FPRN_11115 [Fusarium proliferatum]
MDPIQIPEGQELAKRPAPLGRQPPSFTLAPIPSNINLTQLYQELKPIGLFDPLGNLVGLNFFNNTGYPSDVTTSSSICTGATIYKGQYQVALSHINRHQGSYYVLRTHDHQYFHSLRPTDWRLALMTLRFVGPVSGNAKPIPKMAGNDDDVVVLFLPKGAVLLPNHHPWLPFGGPRPRLVMEGILVGRSYVEASEICQLYLE